MNHKINLLPQVVTRFLFAANRWDAALAAACFSTEAKVHDEDRDYYGREAILEWVTETCLRYRPTYTPLHSFVGENCACVQVAVSGKFPGSPATLDFEWRLHRGKISALTIV